MASRDVMAGANLGAERIESGKAAITLPMAINVQFKKNRGSLRIRPRIKLNRFRGNTRAYLAPGRIVRGNSGVLRSRGGPLVKSSRPPPRARDIGAGAAVQTARTRAAGEVLGVRRNGSVYNVKVLDRGRVRIVTIDAYSGSVLGVR